MNIRLLSYNIHKGRAFFSRKKTWQAIHKLLDHVRPDIVLLQEFLMEKETENWLGTSAYQFTLQHHGFGFNAVARGGNQYGNLILSRFPIMDSFNEDISNSRFERRGLLYGRVAPGPGLPELDLYCCHLDLTHQGRMQQLRKISKIIHRVSSPQKAVILAGDFNDWTEQLHPELCRMLQLQEFFHTTMGRLQPSAPSMLPLFSLDRVYYRGCKPLQGTLMKGQALGLASDHLAIVAELALSKQL